MARSNPERSFFTSAEALTVMLWKGNSSPQFLIADLMGCRLSRTAASGRPTVVKAGRPAETSTSTSNQIRVNVKNSRTEGFVEHGSRDEIRGERRCLPF